MQYYKALRNQEVFAIGCTVNETHISALCMWVKPEFVDFLNGRVVELVESKKSLGYKAKVRLPSDLEAVYTDAKMELLNDSLEDSKQAS